MPTDRLENILSGYVRPKSIGLIHDNFYPLSTEHVELIKTAKGKSDKLILCCSKSSEQENMQPVLQALKFVDSTIQAGTVKEAILKLNKQYPNDNIRLWNKDGTFTEYNKRNKAGTLIL